MERCILMEELKDDLSNYNAEEFKCPSVTVDIAILSIIDGALKILLIKRKYPPFRGFRAIPGGFVDIERKETLEETALREFLEETNLKGIYIEQLKTYGNPDRDPRKRVITVAYFALIPYNLVGKLNIEAGDDAEDAQWFSLKKLPPLAFDHKKILKDLRIRLEGKISYTDIAFKLLPKKFTWSQLQKVYEIILDRPLLRANFRRKIKSMYVLKELKEYRKQESAGRPSLVLKYVKINKL